MPASSANLGPGYDALAAALSLSLELEVEETGEFFVHHAPEKFAVLFRETLQDGAFLFHRRIVVVGADKNAPATDHGTAKRHLPEIARPFDLFAAFLPFDREPFFRRNHVSVRTAAEHGPVGGVERRSQREESRDERKVDGDLRASSSDG